MCNLLDLSIINPVIYSETSYAYDFIYETYVSQELFVKCLFQLKLSSITQETALYLKSSAINYYLFEGSLRGWLEPPICQEMPSENKEQIKIIKKKEEEFTNATRLDCFLEIIDEQNFDLGNLEEILNWSLIQRDQNGWCLNKKTPLNFHSTDVFESINGFSINYETGSIELLVERAKNPSDAMFDSNDIYEVFANQIDYGFFSLDQYNFTHRYHPLQKMRFNKEVAKTNFMLTMFHTDYLLKFFTTGVEMSSKYPFNFRGTIDGLLLRLPAHLKEILSPRNFDQDEENATWTGNAHRFWIKANEIKMHIDDSRYKTVNFYFETPKMRINKHRLKMNSNGELVDDEQGELEDFDSWESKFARNFTKHYDEIAKYFPEFNRLKQLLKLAVCQAYIRNSIKNFTNNAAFFDQKRANIKEYLSGGF